MASTSYQAVVPFSHGDLSDTTASSPHSITTASESPRTATRMCFSRSVTDSPREHEENEVIPKIEEIDEEELEDAKPSVLPSPPEEDSDSKEYQAVVKRPRGRPRKHLKEPAASTSKPLKGRSKTGCITCRRRKKKCDETKPACLHCQKNNVHCEGYPPKDYWQSGKQRAVKGRRYSLESPKELPSLIEGVETELDWSLFDHFNVRVSRILSMFTEKSNPWTQVILPMATNHRGLMHSLLCLSAAHLHASEPSPQLQERELHHFGEALAHLRTSDSMADAASPKPDETPRIDDPTIAQTVLLCLRSICSGDVDGSYRPHLSAARHLVFTQKASNPELQSFLSEFLIYNDVCNSITRPDHYSVLTSQDLRNTDIQPASGAFLGVLDGLFDTLTKVRNLRNRIRVRRAECQQPCVDYTILSEARRLDDVLRKWECPQQLYSPRWCASMLYRQCIWLYLHRTLAIPVSAPSERLNETVEAALGYLRELPPDSEVQSVLLMPLFLLGCSAYSQDHRQEITQAFTTLLNFSNFGNISNTTKLVERMWELMDEGDEDAWDWEGVMQKMGWDFLVA